MSGTQWVALGGFVAVLAVLLLAVARIDTFAAIALLAAFGGYSAAVLHGAHERLLSRPTPFARPRRRRRATGPR